MEKYYVTTPIYYVNSEPHIGSAYTTIVADIVARYKRMRNFDVFFLTGTDEHGQKIIQSATEKGITPKELVDDLSNKFKTLWEDMSLTHDYFVRTTDEEHEKTVQLVVQKMKNKGDIYKGKYEGWYCIPDESFFSDEDIEEKNGKKVCPECGRELKWVEEENYFFKLSKYNDALLELYDKNPEFMQPDFRKNEMYQILKSGLRDLSITRTTFNWGVPLSDDPEHVVYVWVDALINYISALGYAHNGENFKKYWPADLHLIGKEINRFHSIIWPAMLMSIDIELPKKVFAHGWLTVNGEKISKSLGNAIDPRLLMDAYSKDAVRYYLMRDINFGRDGDFSEENLITRYNSDLANDLSNLVHRTLSMLSKYFDGIVQPKGKEEDVDNQLYSLIEKNTKEFLNNMDDLKFTQALEKLWEIVRFSNKYIDLTEPWILGKDESKKDRLSTVLYNLLDSIRNIAIMIYPIMPESSVKIVKKLGYSEQHINENNLGLNKLDSNQKTTTGEPVFQRIDTKYWKKVIVMKKEEEKKVSEENVVELIEFPDFTKVDLRVAQIVEAEDVVKSNKLLKLQLDVGELGKRQIVAGIKKYYSPEDLIGKKIVIVANLKPAKLMGIESQGMLLAAKNEEKLTVLTLDRDIEPGLRVS
jgi:methionyl-tRNA synthetase